MPQAAWCSECAKNVWVGQDGRCPNGHDAVSLSGHYDAAIAPPPGSESGASATQPPTLTPDLSHHMWRRFFAFVIDILILNVVGGVLLIPIGFVWGLVTGSGDTRGIDPILNVLSLVVVYGGFIVLEGALPATPGKRLLGLRVVSTSTGSRITWKQSAQRNVARIVDLLFFGLVGIGTALSSPWRQRSGDRMAGTVVVMGGDSFTVGPDAPTVATLLSGSPRVSAWIVAPLVVLAAGIAALIVLGLLMAVA